jgi:hypothetical protein
VVIGEKRRRFTMTEELHTPETWLPLNYEGCQSKYEISTYGRVKEVQKGVFVSPVLTGDPCYWYVNLQPEEGKRVLRRIHNLVARTFCRNEKPLEYTIVDHIDINKHNNNAHNLRWVDHKINSRNRKVSIYYKGEFFKDWCSKNRGEGYYEKALSYRSRYNCTLEEAVDLTDKEVSGKDTTRIWLEEGVWLTKDDYYKKALPLTKACVRTLRNKGLSHYEILEGKVYPKPKNKEYPYSIESAGIWYPSKEYIINTHGISDHILNTNLREGKPIAEIIACYREYKYYTVQNITGTRRELSEHFGIKLNRVHDRFTLGWGVEKIFTTKITRVRYYLLDGIRLSKKAVIEKLLPDEIPNHVGTYQSKNKISLEDTLQKYGVGVTKISLIPDI